MTSNRSRRGRMTVMMAFLVTAVSLYMGLSLNLSRLLAERAHLQVCADAAAYSAAVQQCRGLNRIARLNNEAATVLRTTRTVLGAYIFPNHDAGSQAALAAEVGYRLYNLVNLARQETVSHEAASAARETARDVTARNAPEARLSVYTTASALGRLVPATGLELRFGFFFKQATPWGEFVLYDPGRAVPARVLKKAAAIDTIAFTAQVRKPRTDWLFTWSSRGSGVADLRAYASAKPGAGTLWREVAADPIYQPALVRTGALFPRPALPDDWGYAW